LALLEHVPHILSRPICRVVPFEPDSSNPRGVLPADPSRGGVAIGNAGSYRPPHDHPITKPLVPTTR
jgi:hypothetical protein